MKKIVCMGLVLGSMLCLEIKSADALWRAVINGNMQEVLNCLNDGVDPDILRDGRAPLHTALDNPEDSWQNIVELLIMRGANVNIKSNWRSPGGIEMRYTPLMSALFASSSPLRMVKLLVDNKADVNAKTAKGRTVLQCACGLARDEETIKFLLEHKAQA